MSSTISPEYASVVSRSAEHTSDAFVSRPTIFDVLAQENMNSLLRPAFNHVLKWLSMAYPTSPIVARLRAYSNEMYVLAHALIEYVYLREYDALFTEYFYGLKRNGLDTDRTKRLLSVVFSVVVPYLKAKFDDFYEELEKTFDPNSNGSSSTDQTQTSRFSRLKKLLINLIRLKIRFLKHTVLKYYQYFHLIWSLVFWYHRFRFMIGKSDVHSPLLSALDLSLSYDLTRSMFDEKSSLLRRFLQLINYSFTNILFFVQFLKWFYDYRENRSSYSSDNNLHLIGLSSSHGNEKDATESGLNECIEPPKVPQRLAQHKAYRALNERGLCPLCNKKRTNQCALSVSGFVFCYPCIFRFVKENKRCPLTHFPCTTKNIIRIYASTN